MPAADIVIGLLVAPGAIVPVLKPPLSAVAVWDVLSAFLQATVWPAFNVPGLGENELLPFMPLIVIVTSAVTVVPAGVPLGEVGVVAIELPPQPNIAVAATRANPAPPSSVNLMLSYSSCETELTQGLCKRVTNAATRIAFVSTDVGCGAFAERDDLREPAAVA